MKFKWFLSQFNYRFIKTLYDDIIKSVEWFFCSFLTVLSEWNYRGWSRCWLSRISSCRPRRRCTWILPGFRECPRLSWDQWGGDLWGLNAPSLWCWYKRNGNPVSQTGTVCSALYVCSSFVLNDSLFIATWSISNRYGLTVVCPVTAKLSFINIKLRTDLSFEYFNPVENIINVYCGSVYLYF